MGKRICKTCGKEMALKIFRTGGDECVVCKSKRINMKRPPNEEELEIWNNSEVGEIPFKEEQLQKQIQLLELKVLELEKIIAKSHAGRPVKVNQDLIDEIHRLHRSKYNNTEIAKELGISRTTVIKHLK